MTPISDRERKWMVLATVALSVFMAIIDSSMVNVALPTLQREFTADFSVVQWFVLSYMLTVTTLILGVARLADIFGKRRMFLGGLVVFTFGSCLCGIHITAAWLVAMRVVQGLGGSVLMALGPALLTEAFPPAERGKALGVVGSVVSLGVIVGPTVGGFLLSVLPWTWLFYVNVPLGILCFLLGRRYLGASAPASRQRFDLWGAVTMFVGLLCALLALTIGQDSGFGSLGVVALFATSAVAFAAFGTIEMRVAQPLVDLRLFLVGQFSLNLFSSFLSFVAVAGTLVLMPFYLEHVLGYDSKHVGLLMAVMPIAMALSSPVAGWLSDKFGVRPITMVALVILTFGFGGLRGLRADTAGAEYVARFLPVGLGLGMFQSPNNSAIMGAVPRDRLGIASGLLALARTLGQTSGIAGLGAVWAARTSVHASEGAGSVAAQVGGIQDTVVVTTALIVIALVVTVRVFIRERASSAAVA